MTKANNNAAIRVPDPIGLAYQKGHFLLQQAGQKFSGIRFDQLEAIWEQVEPWIIKACVRQGNKISADEVKRELLDRNYQLWVARDEDGDIQGICITQILVYPKKKYCRILIGTGKNRSEWQDYIRIIEEWAKTQGCAGMEILARNGWERILTNYSKTHVFLERGF